MSGCGCVRPIVCPPQYCVRDFYSTRTVPVIQPVVNINRQNIVDVPQLYVQQVNQNVVVNRGFANQGQGFAGGFLNRSRFF